MVFDILSYSILAEYVWSEFDIGEHFSAFHPHHSRWRAHVSQNDIMGRRVRVGDEPEHVWVPLMGMDVGYCEILEGRVLVSKLHLLDVFPISIVKSSIMTAKFQTQKVKTWHITPHRIHRLDNDKRRSHHLQIYAGRLVMQPGSSTHRNATSSLV